MPSLGALSETLNGLGLIAVATAIVAAILGSWLHRRDTQHERSSEARRLASALVGEINAIAEIGRQRYEPGIGFALRRSRAGDTVEFYPTYTGNEFFGVYRARVSDLGLLPAPMPEHVVGLYTRFNAIQEDLRTIALKDWSGLPIEQRRLFLSRLHLAIRSTLSESALVSSELQTFVD